MFPLLARHCFTFDGLSLGALVLVRTQLIDSRLQVYDLVGCFHIAVSAIPSFIKEWGDRVRGERKITQTLLTSQTIFCLSSWCSKCVDLSVWSILAADLWTGSCSVRCFPAKTWGSERFVITVASDARYVREFVVRGPHFTVESCCSRSIGGLCCFERWLASVLPCFDRTVGSDPHEVEFKKNSSTTFHQCPPPKRGMVRIELDHYKWILLGVTTRDSPSQTPFRTWAYWSSASFWSLHCWSCWIGIFGPSFGGCCSEVRPSSFDFKYSSLEVVDDQFTWCSFGCSWF